MGESRGDTSSAPLAGVLSNMYSAYGGGGESSEAGRLPTMAQQQHERGHPTRRWNNGNSMSNNYCINNSRRRMNRFTTDRQYHQRGCPTWNREAAASGCRGRGADGRGEGEGGGGRTASASGARCPSSSAAAATGDGNAI